MKQIIYKSLFVLCFLMASMIGIKAQDVDTPAYFKTHDELLGFKAVNMSDNGRYVVCCNGTMTYKNTTRLWDLKTNEVTTIGTDCWGHDVSNDGTVVGEFANASRKLVGGYYKNGEWNTIDALFSGAKTVVYCISSDGKFMGGHSYYDKATNGLKPVVWDSEGKIIKSFGIEGEQDYRAGCRAMSEDGTKVSGWSERVGENYFNGSWIPCFWNKPTGDPLPVLSAGAGDLGGMNNDGTIVVGQGGGKKGIIVKEDGTITVIGSGFMDVSENGLIVGYQVYSEKLGLLSLDEFFRQIYGLEIPNPSHVMAVSDNGEFMLIMTSTGNGFGAAYARVSGDVKPTMPNKVSLLNGAGISVNVAWEKPLFNGHEPIGYHIYRNGEKITSALITGLAFNDPTPAIGKNCYTVTAVYKYTETSQELESPKADEVCIEVIGENSCFSPKKITANVIYNKTVEIAWQRPLPNYKSSINAENNVDEDGEIEYTKIKPNLLKTFPVPDAAHAVSDGKFIYTAGINAAFAKYTISGEFIESFAVAPRIMTRGITYDGEKFYCTANNNLAEIKEMKNNGGFVKMTPVTGLGSFTRIAYLPFLDENKGGFEIGAFKSVSPGTSVFVDKGGRKIEGGGILPGDEAIMGVAYYGTTMYVAKREANNAMNIYLYNTETLEPTGEYINMNDYSNLQITAGSKLWGISVMTSSEGIPCLTVVIAGVEFNSSQLIFLELADMEGLKGYNVYRNDIKINGDTPINTAYFNQDVVVPGDYKYEVTAVFERDCESAKSDAVNITISPIGVVNAPKNISTEIVRNNVIVSWEAPKASTNPKLVGYNVFRDGKQLNKEGEYIKNLFYTDKELALGQYTYSVQAFYNNSGISDKVETKADIRGFNPTLAPTDLRLSQEDRAGIKLDWKVPAVGNYEVMSWNIGAIQGGIGLDEGGVFYVASKWDSGDLAMVSDYTLTDIEFYAYKPNTPHTFYVYVDGEIVTTQEMATVTPTAYNVLKLNTPITLQKGKSLMVAYKVTHAKGDRPVGADYQSNVVGKGDLMSTDGTNWVSCSKYNLKANWAISIRLMPYSVGTPVKMENVEMEVNENKDIKLATSEAVRSADQPIFKNAEVTGYNVYRNDVKINTSNVIAATFTDSSADLTTDNCYSVEAIFTADRTSPKSDKVCSFGNCFIPMLSAVRNATSNLPELKMIVPTTITNSTEVRYYEEEAVRPIAMGADYVFAALLQLKPIDLQLLDGYKITDINAYFFSSDCEISLYAMEDGVEVLNKPVAKKDFKDGMNKFVIDGGLLIDKSKTLWIGLKITTKKGVQTIGIDAGPGKMFKGDVIMTDGKTISTLKFSTGGAADGNWNLSLSLEKDTPLAEQLKGYNIYRDGSKINKAVVTEAVYVDETAVAEQTYIYHATALWSTNCESEASEKIEVESVKSVNDIPNTNMKIYPNPAKDILNIEGEYETVRLYNSVGQECFMQNAEGGKLSINVSNWAKGIYVVEATSANGEVNRGKVIIK